MEKEEVIRNIPASDGKMCEALVQATVEWVGARSLTFISSLLGNVSATPLLLPLSEVVVLMVPFRITVAVVVPLSNSLYFASLFSMALSTFQERMVEMPRPAAAVITLAVVALVDQFGSQLEILRLAMVLASKQMVAVADTAHTKIPHAAGAVVAEVVDELLFIAQHRVRLKLLSREWLKQWGISTVTVTMKV
tara:strand:+ start:279 stop:857 length:579 start_codon:yes stop_codon:yes gene_type:complete